MNRFYFRGHLSPKSRFFVGRKRELSKLRSLLKSPLESYAIIFGAPRIGKTSLLNQLSINLLPEVQFVKISLRNLNKSNADRIYSCIAQELTAKLKIISSIDVQTIDDGFRFCTFLRKLNLPSFVVIALDELLRLPDEMVSDLANTLRSIHEDRFEEGKESYNSSMFILIGGIELYRPVSQSYLSPLYNISEKIYLSDLIPDESDQLLRYGLKQLDWPENNIHNICNIIYKYAQGHPYYTQYLGHIAAQCWEEDQLLPDADFIHQKALPAMIEVETYNIKKMLTRAEQERLIETLSCIKEQPGMIPFKRDDDEIARLELIGLIREENGYCFIRNHIYEQMLPTKVPKTKPKKKTKIQKPHSENTRCIDQGQLKEKITCFNWLHLTDLHRGMKEQHWLWPGVQERFFEDLEKLYKKCGTWDLVLFTGDLTQCGSPKEFQMVDDLLKKLWEHFNRLGSSPKLLAVPGNHDLVRPGGSSPSLLLLQQWANQPEVQNEFWDKPNSPYREVIKTQFENYINWWENQPFRADGIHDGILPGDFAVTIEKDGAKLGIVGLNISFLQLTAGDYEGKLALHARQFNEVCGGNGPKWAKQHHACLLLTHHPQAWLNPDSRKHLNAEITDHGRFVVHLCGHLHETAAREISEGETEARRIWQGHSLFGLEYFGQDNESQRLHGYSAGRIALHGNTGTLLFWPRKTELQGGQRNIVQDLSVVLTDDQHTKPRDFALLQSYSIRNRPQSPETLTESPIEPPSGENIEESIERNIEEYGIPANHGAVSAMNLRIDRGDAREFEPKMDAGERKALEQELERLEKILTNHRTMLKRLELMESNYVDSPLELINKKISREEEIKNTEENIEEIKGKLAS